MHKLFSEDAGGGAPEGGDGAGTVLSGGDGVAKSTPEVSAGKEGIVQEAWFKGWGNEDGTLNKTRYDHLPEDLKDFRPTLERLNTVDDLVRSFKHQRELISKKGLMPLRPDATEAEKKEFDTRLREVLQVPEKPDGYGIARPDDIPEEMWNNDYANKMAEILHKHRASPDLVKEAVSANLEFTRQALAQFQEQQEQQQEQRRQEVNKAVNKEWGADFQKQLQLAKIGAKHLGIDIEGEAFQWHPEVAFAMARAATLFKEARLIDGSTGADAAGSARQQLADMTNNPSNKWYQAIKTGPGGPMWREAIKEQTRLAQLADREGN